MTTKEKALELLRAGRTPREIITQMNGEGYLTIQNNKVSYGYLYALASKNGVAVSHTASAGRPNGNIVLIKAAMKSRLSDKTKLQVVRELVD